MIWHILAWATFASIWITGCGTVAWLWNAGTRVYTWQQKLPVPKVVADLTLSSGSDYVGWI